MENLKATERQALVRAEATAKLTALETAIKTGSGEYVIGTANGYAKVTVSAIKDEDFDAIAAGEAYEAEVAVKAANAKAKAEAKAVKDAEKAAAKAEREALKAAKLAE